MKKLILIFILILLVVFVLRFVVGGDEDTWLCQGGVWVKHGNPSSPVPTGGCDETKKEVVVQGDPRIAEEFIKNSPTYKFDGSDLTLLSSQKGECETCFVFTFSFQSRQAGYGDRTGQLSAQVITDHEIVVTTKDNQVTKAVVDGQYEENLTF